MGWFTGYFRNAPEVSAGKRVLLVILGILLFLSLTVFGPILALQVTVFNPDCIASYVDDIDVSAVAHDWLSVNLAPKNPVLAKSLELIISNLEPQIKGQLYSCVRNSYAFILDRLENGKLLETVAAQRPLVDNLAVHVQAIADLPGLGPVFTALGVSAESIAKSIDVQQINGYFDMLEQLAALKDGIVLARTIYIPLIIFILALIVAIKLIARKPSFISGELGLILAICGALQLFSTLAVNNFGRSAILQFNLPPLIHDWLVRLVGDYTTAVLIYGGVLLLCGIVLIVFYFILKPRRSPA